MSSTSDPAGTVKRTTAIPALKTNSARAILDAFGDSIIQLKASSSVVTTNETLVEELREYGVLRAQETKQTLDIDYTQLQDSDSSNPDNPWDEPAIETLYEHLDAILDAETQSVKPDLAVQSVTIRVTDEALQEVTPARTAEFDLHFEASKAEEALREQTRRANAGRGLYTELGFNVTNLNLHSVIETVTKYSETSDGEYLSWNGPEDDTRPKVNPQLAVRINDRILPDQYGVLKPYHVVDDEVIDVADEALEDDTGDSETDGEPADSEAEN
ncbi:hypothetical protein DM826_07890 [Halonotius aquaticus]|uniref:Uncharacterized protein n=1 Tax=Halonotius aquaticus TaxID=2216978 RepID=A0A3A6PMZ9_9EURY|nr:hypothetical protein [Halonotius aquaticus]RJX42912.1 hypothetical protein DM826_07890 [Halonotius aquaticus]